MAKVIRKPRGREMMEIVQAISNGATVVYPTETCYGLGSSALDEKAVKKVYEIKQREEKRDLSCVVPSLKQAKKYSYLNKGEIKICQEFMPGPLTLVASKKRRLPNFVNDKFAFRVPDTTIARLLSKEIGTPLVSTSANLSGEEEAYSVDEIPGQLKEGVDYIVDYGRLEETAPSTVCEVVNGEVKIWRSGPISESEINKVLSI